MSPSPFSPLPLLLLLLLHCCLSSCLNPTELSALLDIRNNLHDLPGSKFFTTWDFASNDPCTSFAGIICDQFLSVSVLTLGTGLADSPGLVGTLSSSIANLTSLTELVVNPGRITGPIPPSIGTQCHQLRLVSITDNLVSGPIPISFIGLPELHTLDLSRNRLLGSIPPQLIPSLPSLKVLVLADNAFSGPVPPSVSSTQLLHLDLSDNSLTGCLPPLPSTLHYLSATANFLSGPLDSAFSPPSSRTKLSRPVHEPIHRNDPSLHLHIANALHHSPPPQQSLRSTHAASDTIYAGVDGG